MNQDYKRAYQIVLKKVEDLEEQNERLEAENLRRNNLLAGMFEKMDAFEKEWREDSAIHPQSE